MNAPSLSGIARRAQDGARLFAQIFARTATPLLALAALMLSGPHDAHAEGTRTLHPASGTGSTGNRGVMDLTNTNAAGVARQRQFTYVYAREGEVILLGSRNRTTDTGGNRGQIRLWGPAPNFGTKGTETDPSNASAVLTCDGTAGAGQYGLIPNRAAELAGPNSADGSATVPNGFTPCWYQVPVGGAGIYGVRFYGANAGSTNNADIANPTAHTSTVQAWDVTVRADMSSLADLNGRVFTYAWAVYLNTNGRYLRNNLHYVSADGYRYRQTFQGLDPNRAVFYANPKGFIDGGAPLYKDIRGSDQNVNAGTSFNAGVTAERPDYPIFFSDVSPSGPNAAEVNRVLTALAIPQAPLQPQLTAPTFVGNMGGHNSTVSSGGVFTFTTVNTLTYEIVVKRGATGPGDTPPNCLDDYDPANVCNRVMTGVALTGNHSVLWNGLDNSGNPFPIGNYTFQIVGRNGEIHFPMIDLEGNVDGGPTLTKLNAFNTAEATTVYFDDRGHRTSNNTLIGQLNDHLCGAGNLQAQPTPNHSLVGVDSADANWNGTGKYYRQITGSSDPNTDCSNNSNVYFGTAKGLDLWALERSPLFVEPVVIVPSVTGVDVGTMATMTPAVLPGDTSYGSFAFSNAGDTTATGVTYSVTLGNSGMPATCPSAVNFTVVPAGVTATYTPAPACTITFSGMPTTLAPGQSLGFSFNYVVAPSNPGPIPLDTVIAATNETNPPNTAPNTAHAQTVVAKPVITYGKASSPAAGIDVNVGDTITYTVTVSVANAPLTSVFTLTDTLGTGLTFGSITNQSPQLTCGGSVSCTLPVGTGIGSYTVEYTATVNASASGSVANNVTGSGGGGDVPPACVGTCTVIHNLSASDMSPVFGGLPTVLEPGEAVTGATLTCTNAGPGAAAAATCVPSVDAGTISNIVCVPATPVASLPAAPAPGSSIVCTFDYTAPGTPGGSNTPETGVVFTGTTGATNDTNGGTGTGGNNTTTVNAPIIDAVDDTTSVPGGSTNNTFELSTNDQYPPNSTFTYTGGTCANGQVDSDGTATFDATPNPCTVLYQVCAPAPNQTQCDNATLTVTSELADLTPVFGGLPTVLEPGEAVTGATLTCTNAGPDSAANATCVPSVDAGTISNIVCVPATPVASLPAAPAPGSSIVCTFDYTAPGTPGGSNTPETGVVFTGTTGATNDTNGGTGTGGNNTTTVNAPIIDALDDDYSGTPINGGSGGTTPPVVGNDTSGSGSVIPGTNITLTPGVPSGGGLTMDPTTGIITVPPGTPSGTYTFPYEICVLPATVPPACETATATVVVSSAPSMTILKTETSPGPYSLNDTISYNLVVTNTGNEPLSSVSVSDPNAVLGACAPITLPGTLNIGESTTCPATHVVTAADVEAGEVHNSATTTGQPPTPPGGPTPPPLTPPPSTVDTPVEQHPSLAIVKTETSTGPYSLGDTVTYSLVATNNGDVTLTNVSISDPNAVIGTCTPAQPATLAPGAMLSCSATHVVTIADVDAAQVSNTATTTGQPPTPPGGPTPPPLSPPPSTVDVPVEQHPSLTLAKTVTSSAPYTAGDVIAYQFVATNNGDTTLTNVSITDPLPGLSALNCTPAQPTTLAPNAVLTCTANYTVTPADVENGQVHNQATSTGTPPPATPNGPPSDPLPPVQDETDTPITQNPSLTLAKTVTSTGPYTAGDVIAYQFVATNNGDVTLSNVSINDPLPGLSALVCNPVAPATLAPTAVMTCTATYTVMPADVKTGQVHNSATATYTPPPTAPGNPPPPPVTTPPSETDTPIEQDPSLAIVKTETSTGPYSLGDTVTYSLVATNNGDVTLTNVSISDPNATIGACTPAQPTSLGPNATLTCTATHVVTAADVEAGQVINTASTTGQPPTPPGGPTPPPLTPPPSTVETPVEQHPSLVIVKTVTSSGPYTEGDTINYQFVATNTGDVTLTGVSISDPLPGLSALNCTPAQPTTLAPNAALTCTATYTVTPADVINGSVHNSATTTGQPPTPPGGPTPPPLTPPPSTVDTPIAPAELTIVKTGPAYTNLGEEIVFTIVVTNVGTVPAHNVTVTDPVPPGLSFVSNAGACTTPFPCLLGTLAPGASRTISVTLLVAADYDGPDVIINTATVTSTSTTESSSSSAAVPLMLNPYLVPANSNWTLALMALAMLLLGAGTVRRRF